MSTVKTKFGLWAAEERNESFKKTKAAIQSGEIPEPYRCEVCGNTKEDGRIDYHNKNYSDPIEYLVPLCSKCHLRLHNRIKTYLLEQASAKELMSVQDEVIKTMKAEKEG